VELRRYMQIVVKWLWLIVLGTSLAAGATYGISSFFPPVYRASTTLLVRTTGTEGGDDYGTVIVNQYLAATYSELMTKRPIIEAAAQNLGLAPSVARELMTRIEVWVVPNTSVLRLTVEDQDPRLAMELANEIVSVFIQSEQDLRGRRGQDVFVVEPAAFPSEPVAPRKLFNTGIAGVGGCVLAVGFAFLIEYLDDTVGTPEDVQQTLSLPTLAAIPNPGRRRKRRGRPRGRGLGASGSVVVADPTSSVSEAYHVLRTRIRFSGARGRDVPGTLLITSPSSREEKAGIAANLGIALARAGRKVLLVDADLRQPHLHHAFGLANETGLSTLLEGSRDFQACMARTELSSLYVLASGPPSFEPSALLSSQQMTHLIRDLERHADVVLFDAPPILAATDAMALAPQVAGTILVVESRSTLRKTAAQATERLNSVQARVLGVVLNKVRDRGLRHRENGHRR
jgi:succinoglycan biosynthesis transport protein ExoP